MSSIFIAGGRLPSSQLDAAFGMFAETKKVEPESDNQTETAFFESVSEDAMFEAVSKAAIVNRRADAAAAVFQWIEDGDADFDALDAIVFGLAGGTDDEELTDDEVDQYNLLLGDVGDFLVNVCELSVKDVEAMFEGDNDKAEKVFEAAEAATSNADEAEMIAEFSVRESMMLESVKKVVRDGKIVTIKTNRRKRRMTPAQKAALKKARSKANSSAARAARKKAMRLRKSRGM